MCYQTLFYVIHEQENCTKSVCGCFSRPALDVQLKNQGLHLYRQLFLIILFTAYSWIYECDRRCLSNQFKDIEIIRIVAHQWTYFAWIMRMWGFMKYESSRRCGQWFHLIYDYGLNTLDLYKVVVVLLFIVSFNNEL